MSTGVAAENNPTVAISFILAGMAFISVNDVLIKQLSGDYPLHQMVFVRSVKSSNVLTFSNSIMANDSQNPERREEIVS